MPVGPMLVTVDEDGIRELLNDKQAQGVLIEAVQQAAEAAKANYNEYFRTGEHAEAVVFGQYEPADDVGRAYVGSTSRTWHLLEFGSVNNIPMRPLTKALEDVGLTFTPIGPSA